MYFSRPHPPFGEAFQVHTRDLASSAYAFLRLVEKVDDLKLRMPVQRKLDRAILTAKTKLTEFLKELEAHDERVDVDQLLQ